MEKLERIKKILTEWNPAKNSRVPINNDLDNYDTEANDFLFFLEFEYDYPNRKISLKQVQKLLKGILNDAFDLHLTDQECETPTAEIMRILTDK